MRAKKYLNNNIIRDQLNILNVGNSVFYLAKVVLLFVHMPPYTLFFVRILSASASTFICTRSPASIYEF